MSKLATPERHEDEKPPCNSLMTLQGVHKPVLSANLIYWVTLEHPPRLSGVLLNTPLSESTNPQSQISAATHISITEPHQQRLGLTHQVQQNNFNTHVSAVIKQPGA
jgi:hypothetical protein